MDLGEDKDLDLNEIAPPECKHLTINNLFRVGLRRGTRAGARRRPIRSP
jgi:hypothetical protein